MLCHAQLPRNDESPEALGDCRRGCSARKGEKSGDIRIGDCRSWCVVLGGGGTRCTYFLFRVSAPYMVDDEIVRQPLPRALARAHSNLHEGTATARHGACCGVMDALDR